MVYQSLSAAGWQGVDELVHNNFDPQGKAADSPVSASGQRTKSYWNQRLSQRSYLVEAGLRDSKQLSVRLEHDGINEFFPSDEQSPQSAVHFARRLAKSVEQHGWTVTCQQFPREFTMAIFWSSDPVTCTYATMLTLMERQLQPIVPQPTLSPVRRVIIIEPDPIIGETVSFWINQNAGFHVRGQAHDLSQARDRHMLDHCDLVLLNGQTHSNATPNIHLRHSEQGHSPAVIGYGLYEDSNQIFHSVSGVNRGYFLRRRNPDKLLEPVTSQSHDQPFQSLLPLSVRTYFQQLCSEMSQPGPSSQLSLLTRRELEILEHLSAGRLDKEIAERLRISNWTVRNHLKSIYSKLGIHNRIEAAIQYMRK